MTSRVLYAVPVLLLAAGCADEGGSKVVSFQDASLARAWMDQSYAVVRAERLAPPPASRLYGYTAVALWEALVPGIPEGRSLQGQLNGLSALPRTEDSEYSWPVAANAAVAATLRGLLPRASSASHSAIDALEAEQGESRRIHLRAAVFERSQAFGRAVATAILAWADADGYGLLNNCAYVAPGGEGLWIPTPPGFRPPLQPCWGQIRSFVLPHADHCDPPPPIPYSEHPASAFVATAREVFDIVNAGNPAEVATAEYWSDDPGTTGTPPGHWIRVVGYVAEQQGLGLDRAAEAYARTGIAVADAFISCWHTKYVYQYPRPVTAIRKLFDPSWSPILATPPFSEFTSGHSVQSGAVAEVLTAQFGDLAFTDSTHVERGFAPRSYSSFRQAAHEAAESRIFGGIHFREACVVGVTQGECVGRELLARVQFRR